MKKGKSQGSNGFSSGFFKHFWHYLGIFLFRTAKESINNGTLPLSHRESIVTLIPKAGKPPNSSKDWRPIPLLNVDFKIISSAITNRLKNVILHFCSLSMLSGRPLNFVIWSHQIEISGDVSRLSHARTRTKFRTLSGLRKRRLIYD